MLIKMQPKMNTYVSIFISSFLFFIFIGGSFLMYMNISIGLYNQLFYGAVVSGLLSVKLNQIFNYFIDKKSV